MVSQIGLALGLGLLVGMQREWADKKIAGIRTYPLIVLLGTLSAALAADYGGWIVAAAFGGLVLAVALGSIAMLRREKLRPGVTTELSALVMFLVGCLVGAGYATAAIVVTGCVTVLLHWKKPLHGFVEKMGEDDVRMIARLALIGLVILPALPDRDYGPYDVLNPFEIWLMVVLIVGISMAAYVVYRMLGARTGSLLGGLLGGLISSTATTVTYARRSRGSEDEARAAALVVIVASAVVYGRVLFEIAVVAPGAWLAVAPPILVMMVFQAALGAVAFLRTPSRIEGPDQEAPTELVAAVAFGLLYAAVLLGVAFAREKLGTAALYGVAALSGLTDMDAITLSSAQLMNAGRVDEATAWRLILVGSMANLVFKGVVVGVLGSAALRKRVAAYFAVALAGGGLVLWLWP